MNNPGIIRGYSFFELPNAAAGTDSSAMLGFDLVYIFNYVLTVPLGTAADSSYLFAFAADQHLSLIHI